MTDHKNEDDKRFIPNIANQAIVTHPIPPEALFLPVEWLAPLPWVLGWEYALAKKPQD